MKENLTFWEELKVQLKYWFPDDRPDWDQYGLFFAFAASIRGDCSRRRVGAVLLDKDHRLFEAGYNGSYPGGPSCLSGECPRAASNVVPGSSYDTGPGSCHAVHAEANALLFADRERVRGATLYITDEPCNGCMKLIQNTPLARVVWPGGECVRRTDVYSDGVRVTERSRWTVSGTGRS